MIPGQLDAKAADQAALEKRFRELEAEWNADTEFLSSYTKIVGHPAFRAIIDLGPAVIPLMLRDLEQEPQLWVWALPHITGENPVPDDAAGDIAKMSEAWLNWGRARGFK